MGNTNNRTWLENVRKGKKRAQDLLWPRRSSPSAPASLEKCDETFMFRFLTADMNAGTPKPPVARFEELFVSGVEWTEERVREMLAGIGIDTMFIAVDWDPGSSLRALSRKDVERMDRELQARTGGWKLVCAREDEQEAILRYVRPMLPPRDWKGAPHD